ncbi:NUDIX domain-containing protein [Mangrovibacterium diazotrophicum]|uniref:NUDIX domain-containing protein n=1 Tax=Mangrovibacterium diazotrophicum TaxID=1261403 RepID=A0A419VX46_9BACT|nr:NUDIX domain-containing protein [Mangrovibacterium diazotrophicum]RKD87805.1 NUDIX domain-containing protein [Mangrovibacterium diazotrophicum]
MPNNQLKHFNIRVYGLFLNAENHVLVSDEYQLDTRMTKFPGGGLEFGEGTIDCLRREMREECQQEIIDIQHFYTTDFFQQALYFNDHQLISIYYTAKIEDPLNFKVGYKPFDFEADQNGNQSFRWVDIGKINADEFTFPIDKHVANLLREKFQK